MPTTSHNSQISSSVDSKTVSKTKKNKLAPEARSEPKPQIGVIIVDHGSRRAESNAMLIQGVEAFRASSRYKIVEPAHMELADPTIAQAFTRCVAQGAEQILVFPYFLLPGRHWKNDIPRLVRQAAKPYPNISHTVTKPFALHPKMLEIIEARIEEVDNNS